MANTVSGSDEATCPIVRDVTTNLNGLTDLELNLVAGDAGTAICNAHSLTASGASVLSVSRSRSTTGKLDWGSSLNSSASQGTYAIRCDIPANWMIASYLVNEP